MKIKEAFQILISDKAACEKAGMGTSNHKQLRKRLRDNDPLLTMQTMLHWLVKAGWTYSVECIPPERQKPTQH
jgi:hypothetical protein